MIIYKLKINTNRARNNRSFKASPYKISFQPYVTNLQDRTFIKPFPSTIYNDSLTNKDKALNDNKQKCGVYR